MKLNIVCLILIVLLSIVVFFLFMQQDQISQKLDRQIESLKKRISVIEIQPQTGQDDEKTKLATQLIEANTKLINADFGKFERELRDSNNKWLWGWTGFFVGVVAIIGIAFWFSIKSLIADRVEGYLNGFQEAFEQVNELKDDLGILEKEHAVSVLDNSNVGYPSELEHHDEATKALSEEMLLNIFSDKTRDLGIRWAAADVLVAKKSERLVSPMLTFLNSIVISNVDKHIYDLRFCDPHIYWDWLNRFCNEETYQGLKDFLNHLIKEDSKNKDLFLIWTVYLLSQVSLKMDLRDPIDMLKQVIPDLKEIKEYEIELITLVEYFDKFQEPEGISQIMTHHAEELPELKEKCLELLEKYDYTNTEGEGTDESERPE